MGYSSEQSNFAIWKTENVGIPNAVEYLSSHDEPITLPERIPLPITDSRYVEKPKLSREEPQKAALELQRKIREERIARGACEAREMERQRILQTKANLETQAIIEEAQRKRDIAERERHKKESEQHRIQIAAKLRLDFIERLGYEPPSSEENNEQRRPPPIKGKDRILYYLNLINKYHEKEIVKNCLGILRVYLGNIESNSGEKKFHRIKYVSPPRYFPKTHTIEPQTKPFQTKLPH